MNEINSIGKPESPLRLKKLEQTRVSIDPTIGELLNNKQAQSAPPPKGL